jgi:tetratricopeptide (TPR) repeat protein
MNSNDDDKKWYSASIYGSQLQLVYGVAGTVQSPIGHPSASFSGTTTTILGASGNGTPTQATWSIPLDEKTISHFERGFLVIGCLRYFGGLHSTTLNARVEIALNQKLIDGFNLRIIPTNYSDYFHRIPALPLPDISPFSDCQTTYAWPMLKENLVLSEYQTVSVTIDSNTWWDIDYVGFLFYTDSAQAPVSRWIKKAWNDPVGSKVIAAVMTAAILAIGATVWGYLRYSKGRVQSSAKVLSPNIVSPQFSSKLRIVIAEFQPVSEYEISEAKQLKDRIIDRIYAQKEKSGVEIEIVNVNEVIDPLTTEGDILADKLGKELNAQIVICGKLRHDEEYYFRPFIYNYITNKTTFEKIQAPALKIGPHDSHVNKVILKEQNINNMIDFISYIGALAHYESKDYYLSAQIMQTIESPSADHYFFIASALYLAFIKNDPSYTGEESTKLDEIILQLDKAIKLNPNYEEAWFDKGYLQYRSYNMSGALLSIEKAISINPNPRAYWLEKSLILYGLGRRKEALAAFQHAENFSKNRASGIER